MLQSLLGWQYRTTVLILCMGVYFGSRVGQVTLSTLAPEIVTSLGITMGLFGIAFTGLSTMSSLAQLPSGILSDRYSERVLLMVAIVFTCTSTLLLALSPTYSLFFVLMLAVGLGSGLYYTPSTVLLDELYDQIGQAIGMYRVSGQVAGVVAPVLVGLLGLYVSWRATLFAIGFLLVPILGSILVFMRPTSPNNPQRSFRSHTSPSRLSDLLSRPGLAATTVLASLIQFVEVAAFTFLPALLQQYHGLSTALAGALYALYFATVALLQPVSGRFSDRFGRTPITAAVLVAGVIGYGLLTQPVSSPVLVGAVLLTGVAMTWGAPVQSQFLDQLGDTERGVGFGLVRTIYLLVGALGSVVVGSIITQGSWPLAFGVLAGLLSICLLLLFAQFVFRTVSSRPRTVT